MAFRNNETLQNWYNRIKRSKAGVRPDTLLSFLTTGLQTPEVGLPFIYDLWCLADDYCLQHVTNQLLSFYHPSSALLEALLHQPRRSTASETWQYLLLKLVLGFLDRMAQQNQRVMEQVVRELQELPEQAVLYYLRYLYNKDLDLTAQHAPLMEAMGPLVVQIWQDWATRHNEKTMPVLDPDWLHTVVYLTHLLCTAEEMPFKSNLPLGFMIQCVAGKTNVQSLTLREAVFKCLGSLPLTTFVVLTSAHLEPHMVEWACCMLLDFPKMDLHYQKIILLLLSHLESMPTIQFATHRPYLFEQTIHRLVVLAQEILAASCTTKLTPAMCLVLAFELFSWYSIACPYKNVIESTFWTLTTLLNQRQQYGLQSGQLRLLHQSLQAGLGTPGNRRVVYRLWQLCDATELQGWRYILPKLKNWHCPPLIDTSFYQDSITQQSTLQLYKFSSTDAEGVGLETMIHHFAINGLTNPFTNLDITWENLYSENPQLHG